MRTLKRERKKSRRDTPNWSDSRQNAKLRELKKSKRERRPKRNSGLKIWRSRRKENFSEVQESRPNSIWEALALQVKERGRLSMDSLLSHRLKKIE